MKLRHDAAPWRSLGILNQHSAVFGEHRRAERPECLAVLDAAIELIANRSPARICEQRAVAQSPRTELHAALKPADDQPFGDQRRRHAGRIGDLLGWIARPRERGFDLGARRTTDREMACARCGW